MNFIQLLNPPIANDITANVIQHNKQMIVSMAPNYQCK